MESKRCVQAGYYFFEPDSFVKLMSWDKHLRGHGRLFQPLSRINQWSLARGCHALRACRYHTFRYSRYFNHNQPRLNFRDPIVHLSPAVCVYVHLCPPSTNLAPNQIQLKPIGKHGMYSNLLGMLLIILLQGSRACADLIGKLT